MNSTATTQAPFAERFPAYLTAETAAACLKASKQRRAEVLERRATDAKTTAIRADVEQAVRALNRGAKIVQFPGCAA